MVLVVCSLMSIQLIPLDEQFTGEEEAPPRTWFYTGRALRIVALLSLLGTFTTGLLPPILSSLLQWITCAVLVVHHPVRATLKRTTYAILYILFAVFMSLVQYGLIEGLSRDLGELHPLAALIPIVVCAILALPGGILLGIECALSVGFLARKGYSKESWVSFIHLSPMSVFTSWLLGVFLGLIVVAISTIVLPRPAEPQDEIMEETYGLHSSSSTPVDTDRYGSVSQGYVPEADLIVEPNVKVETEADIIAPMPALPVAPKPVDLSTPLALAIDWTAPQLQGLPKQILRGVVIDLLQNQPISLLDGNFKFAPTSLQPVKDHSRLRDLNAFLQAHVQWTHGSLPYFYSISHFSKGSTPGGDSFMLITPAHSLSGHLPRNTQCLILFAKPTQNAKFMPLFIGFGQVKGNTMAGNLMEYPGESPFTFPLK
jgi:hypothetical protein